MYNNIIETIVCKIIDYWENRFLELETLSNLIYLCDVEAATSYGQRLTSINYETVKNGVWSNELSIIISKLAKKEKISVEKNKDNTKIIDNISSHPKNYLTKRGSEVIRRVVTKYKNENIDKVITDVFASEFMSERQNKIHFPSDIVTFQNR